MKAIECKRYFDRAAAELSRNPYLAPYLVGLAHAWRLAGVIDETTCKGMEQTAKRLRSAAGGKWSA